MTTKQENAERAKKVRNNIGSELSLIGILGALYSDDVSEDLFKQYLSAAGVVNRMLDALVVATQKAAEKEKGDAAIA